MKKEDSKFLKRRTEQSLPLEKVEELALRAKLIERPDPSIKGNRNKVSGVDTENIFKLLVEFGENTLPIGEGYYLHAIEIAKALKLFKHDAAGEASEKRDSGTIRVQRLMASVKEKLLSTLACTIANLPAAGYRIASDEEALFEMVKSTYRSFGHLLGVTKLAKYAIDPRTMSEERRARFREIAEFAYRMREQFKEEFPSLDEDDDDPSPLSDVFDRPPV